MQPGDAAKRRRRRTPEQGREQILAAATDLIARHGPDGVGLREVAEAAGVTHGLVSHYFGTYRALVRAVLRRAREEQRARVRERLRADGGVPYADAMTELLFATLADERYVRLFTWSSLYAEDADEEEGTELAQLTDAIEEGVRLALPGPGSPDRARIEEVVLLALSGACGYAIGRRSWLAGLGHDPADPRHDAAFRRALASALARYLSQGPLAE